MIKVSIIGATGYVGLELMRLLNQHPQVSLTHLVSQSYAGQMLSEVYPSLVHYDHRLEALDPQAIAADSDVVITALPHGASAEIIAGLSSLGCRIIDMSADFRYRSADVYQKWYHIDHPAKDLLATAVYGLPELHRDAIRSARLVGNPGCYTTCSILGLAPLTGEGLIDPDGIIIDAKSGATGAGAKLSQGQHFCSLNENMRAYSIAKHRHTSEIEQELSLLAGQEITLSFTPHILPIERGIFATCYAPLSPDADAAAVEAAYEKYYQNEPFVHFTGTSIPELAHVVGSNYCHIGYCIDPRTRRIIVVSVLDNMIKGAAGQAVQNLNLMFGLDEKCGLSAPAWMI